MASARISRPLPGIRFEAQPPPPLSILPRMDIAAFVGFAASGPVHTPVAVEDAARFAEIFGEDAPLFWDEREGEQVSGLLAPAVRSFFRNGGRRCWVVRVAARAAGVTRFPVPGLVFRRDDGFLRPATLVARSQGSWADGLRLGAALASEGLAARAGGTGAVEVEAASGVAAGDVLRLTYRGGALVLLAAVAATDPHPERRGSVLARLDPTLWLARRDLAAGTTGTARFVGADGRFRAVPATLATTVTRDSRGAVALDLGVGIDGAPDAGALVRADLGAPVVWLRVRDVRSTGAARTRVSGDSAWPLREGWRAAPAEAPQRAERLTLELRVTRGEGEVARLVELGFVPGHARYLGDLPTDDELFSGDRAPSTAPAPLWREAAEPRFPLAAPRSRRGVYLPLLVPALAEDELAPWLPAGSPLHRDGLDRFDSSLFLDRALADLASARLQSEADHLRYEAAVPRPLTGIHSLFGVDEPTILAAPDAVQRPWYRLPPEQPPAPESPDQPPDPAAEGFRACATRLLATPVLEAEGPDTSGNVSLRWSATDADDAVYVVQESQDARFAGAVEIYSGPARSLDLFGRGTRVAYYRVRAEARGNVSRWSEGATVVASRGARWSRIEPERGAADVDLAAVHAALLRLCAARGDVLALLSLPSHYRVEDARTHLAELASTRERMLGAGEQYALSYGALYHPWLVAATPERPLDFRAQPPEGAAAGVLARRALTRGAWVAPANEPLVEVVARVPDLGRETLQPLQDLQVNAVRRAPEGFLWLASDTLAPEPERRPLNVRRLLNLLRRAALRNGTPYVFEPNGAELHRRVQRGFEALLGRLFDLGAFAGATREDSFRVDVSADEERLLVELRVAPSLPLRFLTVRLLQRGDGAVVVEEA